MESGLHPPKLITINRDNSVNYNKIWEIEVPRKNSLFWSIIMAYLTTPRVPDVMELKRRMHNIVGDRSDIRERQKKGKKQNLSLREFNENSLKKRLQNFNPFKNRHTFYFDKEMAEILQIFKWRLNKFSFEMDVNTAWGDDRKLEGASQMLPCSIEVCYVENGVVQRYASFPKTRLAASEPIVLFQHINGDVQKFRFGMNISLAKSLQRLALSFILKKAGIEIQPDTEDKLLENNEVFINVLNNMEPSKIIHLYRSPYIILKLSEAAFETNPLAEDSDGLSAFSNALREADAELCRTLYDSAVNSHWMSGSCVRNPDECVVESLQQIKKQLEKDRKTTNNFEDCSKWSITGKENFHTYTRFNEFQLKFAQKAITLNEKDNFIFRKNFILDLLNSYAEFSYNEDSCDNNIWFQNYLDAYTKHNIYYEILDSFTCILFFDNLNNLLENIPIEQSSVYGDITLDFLLLTLCNKNLAIDSSFRFHGITEAKSKKCFSLIFKMNLKAKFTELSNKLQNITIPPQIAIKSKIDDFYRKALTDAPEIKDEIITSRVKKYLDAVSFLVLQKDATDEEKNTAALAIQRTIQILGESLKPSTTRNCVVSYLLCSCLPLGWEKCFIKARNFMSHLKGNAMQGRLAIEKNHQLLLEIQEQLATINSNFKIVYLFQEQRINKFFITRGLKELKKIPSLFTKSSDNYQKYSNQLLDIKCITEYVPLLKRYINYLKFCLDESCCIKLFEGFRDKLIVLGVLIENLQCSPEYTSQLLSDYEECRKMLSVSVKTESCICIKHKNPAVSDTEKKEFEDTLCKLQLTIQQFSHRQENQDFSDNMKSAVEFDKLINISIFTDQEKFLILEEAQNIYDKTKSELEICIRSKNIAPNESTKLLESFIFDPQLIKRSKLDINDALYIEKIFETCCFSWEALKSKLQKFVNKSEFKQIECQLLLKLCSPECVLGSDLKEKIFNIMNKKIEFLSGRIHFIKLILIDLDEEISQYFQWGKSEGLKHHTKFLMIQRYRKDMEVRASLEMLLLDCSNIFERKDLKDLWEKTEYLLAGINIGDVLAHGNVILDTIGSTLDPNDLPTELVGKMTELVKDYHLVSKMVELSKGNVWYENKDAFRNVMRKEKYFSECPRSESYLELMPYL